MKEIAAKMVSVPARREPGDVCDAPGTVAAAGLHADEGGAFGARLPIDEGSAGCAGAGANGGAVVQYPRYGCRRIRIFLGRDGYAMSPGRAYRLWLRARLQLPRKRPRNQNLRLRISVRGAARGYRPQQRARAVSEVWVSDVPRTRCAPSPHWGHWGEGWG